MPKDKGYYIAEAFKPAAIFFYARLVSGERWSINGMKPKKGFGDSMGGLV